MGATPKVPNMTLVAVDWGSSHVRAELWVDGTCRGYKGAPLGVLEARQRGFLTCLQELCGSWFSAHRDLTLILSGMVGSREGLVEVPYVDAPAGAEELARALVEIAVDGVARAYVVPGLRTRNGKHVDVMRGEETQVIGALVRSEATGTGLYCLPGTHSKWVRTEGQRITGFRTFVTGETFGLFSKHGLLASLMTDELHFDTAGFDAGLARSGEPLGLLHHLFSARADVLGGLVGSDVLPAFLSGLLIGHELRAVPAWVGEGAWPPPRLHLVGAPDLTVQYARGLTHFGAPADDDMESTHALGALTLAALRREARP